MARVILTVTRTHTLSLPPEVWAERLELDDPGEVVETLTAERPFVALDTVIALGGLDEEWAVRVEE